MELPNIDIHRRRSIRRFSAYAVTLVLATLFFVGTSSFSSSPNNSGTQRTGDAHVHHLKRRNPPSAVGWHSRALARPTPAYDPQQADLVFGALQYTNVGTRFTVALFSPYYAVDAGGRVLEITASDFAAFQDVIQQAEALPQTGWGVDNGIKYENPVDALRTATGLSTTVYGWNTNTGVLLTPKFGYTTLPAPLQSLIGLVREAWEGTAPPGAYNQTLIDQIRSL
ncbi:hypothetical protein PIIN_08511 [Serendipita indica DSM 11827]|uniref:Uncharacterized protein n=1 Tax=Serendipita indica (strain DSM 11827) TaxID=1109443 RepID=G4TTB6_SERID|nr:hypothetical protein PIIN_08511 [Serendipita indica DSM 11827]